MFFNKKIMFLGFLVFGLVGAFFLRSYLKSRLVLDQKNNASYSVAILVPVSHPALEEIQQGFLETLLKKISFSYDVYNANGDRTLLRHQAEEIVSKNYDLVFTIATGPALVIKEVCNQRGSKVPVVAGAVDNPVGIHLIESMESSGNNITAVTSCDNFDQQISLLQFLKPNLKNMLLIYNPTPGLDIKKEQLLKLCKQKSIQLNVLEIYNMSDLLQKAPAFVGDQDAVLVLKDNMIVSGIESLVTICNKAGTTLYASDLNSGDKGAALSYGVYEYQDGVESAAKAFEILNYKKNPSDVPSSATTDFKLKLNTAVIKEQGLHIDARIVFLMKSGEVV